LLKKIFNNKTEKKKGRNGKKKWGQLKNKAHGVGGQLKG